jgi:hypothetical protein
MLGHFEGIRGVGEAARAVLLNSYRRCPANARKAAKRERGVGPLTVIVVDTMLAVPS